MVTQRKRTLVRVNFTQERKHQVKTEEKLCLLPFSHLLCKHRDFGANLFEGKCKDLARQLHFIGFNTRSH